MRPDQVDRWVRGGLTGISRPLAILGTCAVLAIMAVTTIDVAVRTFVGGSFGGLVEYSEVLIVVAVFLGLGYTQLQNRHVGVDLLITRLPERAGRWVQRVGLTVCAVVLALMVRSTGQAAWVSYQAQEFRFGVAQVPIWPAKVALCLGLAVWLLVILYQVVRPPEVSGDIDEQPVERV